MEKTLGSAIKNKSEIIVSNRFKELVEHKYMKTRSIMTVPIIGVSYKIKKQTTICRIKWINPATGNTQITCGIATCNPDDKFDEQIGQRLAESRAKVNMYSKYLYVINDKCSEAKRKHRKLINKELEHQAKIKPSKENNM